MCVAPMMSTRAGGTSACRKTSPSGVSCSSLSPLAKCWRMASSPRSSSRSKNSRRPSSRRVLITRPRRLERASIARSSRAGPLASSRRSRNTLIWPPQGRPTCQAVSSATPKVSVLGLPSARMSSASAMTSPSTQPPETEPSKRPSAATTICPPTPTGAEPQVPTTVASATRPSLSSQDARRFQHVVRRVGAIGTQGLGHGSRLGLMSRDAAAAAADGLRRQT